jgi:hypothetical protein
MLRRALMIIAATAVLTMIAVTAWRLAQMLPNGVMW